jgi:hypothetical protein
MSACKTCSSPLLVTVTGKTSDMCYLSFGEKEHDGYVPYGIGICEDNGGDYIEFTYCLDCGTIQSNDFPISATKIGKVFK